MILFVLSIAAWGLVHSWLASLDVKDAVRRALGETAARVYRLAYNIFSVLSLAAILLLVRSLPDHLLYTIRPPGLYFTLALQALAALCGLAAVLQTDALAFVGLKQLAGDIEPSGLITGGFYRYVRHPLYLFGLLILWLTPVMTLNLFVASAAFTAYLLVGAAFEERKLLRIFGADYAAYRARTPMLLPLPKWVGRRG